MTTEAPAGPAAVLASAGAVGGPRRWDDGPEGSGDDAGARRAVFADLDATLFVGAGAGTGKTTALVDRLVALLVGGRAGVDEVAAITFTEAAAAELRARAHAALVAVAEARPWRPGAPTPPVPPEVAARRAAAAVADFDRATITTLHGFARAVLAAHPLAAGVPPVFTVLDESAAGALLDREWADTLAVLAADPAWADTLQRATVVGIRLDQLRALFERLTANWDRVHDHHAHVTGGPGAGAPPAAPAGPGGLPGVDAGPVLGPLGAALGLAATCTDAADHLLAHLQRLRPLAGRLAEAPDDLARLAELQAVDTLGCTRGQKGNWPGGVDEVRQLCGAAQQARNDIVARVGRRCLDDLGRFLAHRVLLAADDRCRRGELVFHDLLVLARQLIRHDATVRRAVGGRFRYLLLDELQDTDPIQAELAVRIAADGDPDPEGPWTALAVQPGRLFLVGDPKQAIYRFRRADVAVVDDIRRVAGDQQLELSGNWRSVPGVIDWVNAVVGPMLGPGRPGVQAAYHPLEGRRPALLPGPPVVVVGGPDPQPRSARQRRQAATAEVADLVRRAIGTWPVDGGRRLAPDDVCILLPSRTALPQLEAALAAAGLEYRLDSGSLIYASAQVRDVLAVLRAVDDPADPAAALGALRSPLLGCGDDELAAFATAGGRWDCRDPAPARLSADHRVVAALAELRHLHEQRWWLDPGQLVALVVQRTEAVVLALDERRWRDAWRRLRFLVAEARTFCDQVGGDLRQFLAWAERRADEHARTTDLDLPAGEDGAVHVMTIHGAKGLEFPAVVVCGLDGPPAARPSVDALFGPPGVELRAGRHRTAGYDGLDAHEEESEAAERVRLLYVAMTRARDHLVVALHHDPKVRCAAADLYQACGAVPHLWRSLAEEPPTVGADVVPPDSVDHVAADAADDSPGSVELGGPAQLALPLDRPAGVAPEADAGPPAGGAVDPFDERPAVTARRAEQVARLHRQWSLDFERRLADARQPTVIAATAVAGRMAAPDPEAGGAGHGATARPGAPSGDTDLGETGVVEVGVQETALDVGAPLVDDAPVDDMAVDDMTVDDMAVDDMAVDDGAVDDGAAPPWRRRGRAATAVGRAVHATLHMVDLGTGEGLPEAARAAAAAEDITEQHRQVERLARVALDSPVVRQAVAGGRWWREVYVGAPVGARLVEGFVDLLVEHGDGLEVVDYKTDLVADDAAVDAAVDRYRHQAAAYALALRATVDRPVTRCSFVFLRGRPDAGGGDPGAVVRTLAEQALDAAVGEVETWLGGPGGGAPTG